MVKIIKTAVVNIAGKQHLVAEGEVITTEKIEGKKGDKINFDQVLMVKDNKLSLGTPLVKQARVKGEVVEQFKDKKIRVATYKAKSRYRRVKGHRQQKTKVKILKITSS